MRQCQVNVDASVNEVSHQTSPSSCQGEYCSLIHTQDPQRDLIQHDQNGKIASNELESRDRAFSVIKRLFTKSELEGLEESGKFIHLRIPQQIRQGVLRSVPKKSKMLSQKEHRLSLLEVTQAEEISSSSFDVCNRSCTEKMPKGKKGDGLLQRNWDSSNEIPVCESCYYVYRLMSHVRCLLSNNYILTELGKAELEVFGLDKILKQSNQVKKKVSIKRNTQTRIALKTKLVQSVDDPQRQQSKPIYKTSNKNKQNKRDETIIKSPSSSAVDNTRKKGKNRKMEQSNNIKINNNKSSCISEPVKHSASNKCKSSEVVSEANKVFNYDSKTSFPYTVLGDKSKSLEEVESFFEKQPKVHNMIVCHDLFDTQERMKIFLLSLIEQNPYHRILLWNYPGQAFTTFSPTQSLNNDFHANCLNKLLLHIGPDGTNEFDTTKPFCIFGHGHGGSIACSYALKCPYSRGLRGICLINPLTFIDTHFASVIHDCRNVFSCSPETRPDLPMYFYSRFIFSQEYLKKVSTPLALNLYTAVHNPITVKGRVSLCNGALNNIDLREHVRTIRVPIVSVHGNHSELMRPLHAETFLEGRDQCATIPGTLNQKGKKKTLLIMVEGGHELIQEKKKVVLGLVEELLIGQNGNTRVSIGHQKSIKIISDSENKWSNVLERSTKHADTKPKKECSLDDINGNIEKSAKGQEEIQKLYNIGKSQNTKKNVVNIVLDPKNPSFERQQNSIYKPGTGTIYPSPKDAVKSQEFMSWRLKRNRKRLSRFQKAAKIIQGSLRVYMAKTMFSRLKRQRSALCIQKCFRGMVGRRIFNQRLKELWAAQFVQRTYRGALGRRTSYYRRLSIEAQINIARIWRGYVDRQMVNRIVKHRNTAAIYLQSLWRRCMAIDLAKHLRIRKFGATTIQRIFRGYKGRKKADMERDKYVFSRSQSMGIELGRQMLVEHKLHATRLQSELSILEKEKTSLESKIDTITIELNAFQQEASKLEKTMHEISLVEAQKRSDISAQRILREKKVQLDQGFSRLLAKISDRKNQLKVIEEKLCLLDKNKGYKTEKLKKLERRLVAILEAQENELSEIRRRQDEKIETIAKTGIYPSNVNTSQEGLLNPERKAVLSHETKKTKELMSSTETMMKFGFMSMAMTYFTSMNMVGAMKDISTKEIHELDSQSIKDKFIDNGHSGQSVETKASDSNVLHWNVDNVTEWLSAIYLKQYNDVFRDASIDGPFLCQLTDNDLKDALGIEHILHRKKILFGINQLKKGIQVDSTPTDSQHSRFKKNQPGTELNSQKIAESDTSERNFVDDLNESISQDIVEIKKSNPSIDQISRWIRNQKDGKIKEILRHLSDKDFDHSNIRVQFVEGLGTAYIKSVDDQVFHINKCDEHGNTLMHVAAQNGNMKIAMFLILKGANPDHQNKQGQTPGHFALSYQFYEFASWLFDPEGGKGNDLLTNMYGLGPYDGLTDE